MLCRRHADRKNVLTFRLILLGKTLSLLVVSLAKRLISSKSLFEMGHNLIPVFPQSRIQHPLLFSKMSSQINSDTSPVLAPVFQPMNIANRKLALSMFW